MAHQKPLVFIGEELSIGKVTAIRNNGVDLTKDGKMFLRRSQKLKVLFLIRKERSHERIEEN